MGKAKKRIATIFTVGAILVIIILLFYMDISKRKNNEELEAAEGREQAVKLLERDLETNYPETPREVAKYYSSITEALYSGLEDQDVEALAIKILELYDEEFLQNNTQEKYLTDLYSEIAAWNKAERTITNFLLVNDELETRETVDGKEYATVYVSYIIMERGKVSEVRKYLLRKNEEGNWKILGWETLPKEE